MNGSREGLFNFLIILFAVVSANAESDFTGEFEQAPQDLPRYVVFPGLDADSEEVAEWSMGFASPFNVFFGPKPYILGWVGDAAFGPPGDEEIGEGEGDYEEEEDEEGEEIEGEEGLEGEGEEEDVDPNYDYEKV